MGVDGEELCCADGGEGHRTPVGGTLPGGPLELNGGSHAQPDVVAVRHGGAEAPDVLPEQSSSDGASSQ